MIWTAGSVGLLNSALRKELCHLVNINLETNISLTQLQKMTWSQGPGHPISMMKHINAKTVEEWRWRHESTVNIRFMNQMPVFISVKSRCSCCCISRMKIQIRIRDLLVYNRVNHFNKLTLIGSLAEYVLHVTLLPLYFRQLKKGSHNYILAILSGPYDMRIYDLTAIKLQYLMKYILLISDKWKCKLNNEFTCIIHGCLPDQIKNYAVSLYGGGASGLGE